MLDWLKRSFISHSLVFEILQKAFLTLIIRASGAVTGFFFTSMISQNYGANGLGAYALSFSTATLLTTIILLGFDLSLMKYTAIYSHKSSEKLVSNIILSALVYIIPGSIIGAFALYFSASTLSHLMNADQLTTNLLQQFSYIVPVIVLVKIFCAILRGTSKVLWAQFIDGLCITVFAGLVIFKFAEGTEEQISVIAYSVGATIAAISALSLIAPHIKQAPSPRAVTMFIRKLMRTGLPSMVAIFTLLITEWMYLFFLSNYSDLSEVGIFRVSWQVSMLIAFVTVAADSILSPKVASLYAQAEIKLLTIVLNRIVLIYAAASISLLILISLFSEPILSFFGDSFTQAKPILITLCIYQAIAGTIGIGGKIMVMTGHEKIELLISVITLILVVVLSIFIVPKYGAIGAAIIAVSTMLFRCLLTSYIVAKKLHIYFIWPEVLFQK
ncbi:oligosaccharide flippase family protein [Kordiimonas sediminis]|nr:oligosaccharide flippase family protein [Kordiimonas sediminis]